MKEREPPRVQVRIALPSDAAAAADLIIEGHEFHARALPERLLVPDSYELEELHLTLLSIIGRDDAAILLAEVDGSPVGLAELYMREDVSTPVRGGLKYAYVQNLLVTEKQRRGGAGTALMTAVEAWARSMDAAEVQLDVWEFDAGPLPFYQRLGYGTLRRKMVKSL